MNAPIRVLVVDDSAVVRQVMSEILSAAPGIEVVGTASDPIFAMAKMRRDWPDVITLDVEMPRMDGISFLRQLMAERPTPVIVCSTLTSRGAETTMQALAAGAVSIIAKPTLGLKGFLNDSAQELVAAVRAAARANLRALRAGAGAGGPRASARMASGSGAATGAATGAALARLGAATGTTPAAASPARAEAMAETTDRIIALGTSTGGTQALEAVLRGLPRTVPGIVVVQHMPEKFTAMFAQRLDQVCALEVLEAQDGQRVIPGRVLIAPGGRHMTLRRSGAQYLVEVRDGPPVNRHRPSVDVLFRSVARCAGRNALGVIMTGMGDDGARGLREMFDAGAQTIAQDEASSVVFGMPKEAIRLGAASRILALQSIGPALEQYARGA
ncbi:protein-glutamate methylesterase/protein-glutamine glutaminase [Thauera phenylacetica]|jgi:two-component system chemotaxis response regulator CheB